MSLRGLTLLSALVIITSSLASSPASAGTTGGINGTVFVTGTTQPIAGADVSAVSPSETAKTTTDAAGHFSFVSLSPDTYTLTASKTGYDTVSVYGVTVQSDNFQNVALQTQLTIKTLGRIVARSSASLVKPGTTANVYSVNAATSAAAAALGGGFEQNNAASAIAAVPGAFVPQGQIGIYPSIFIRGGNYTHVGYEYDGVPLQRAFDQYPGADLSTLGQQELQVYTGAAPVNSDSTALAGFVNQVIRTGSYPGFGTIKVGVGTPAMANSTSVEVGGATPDRMFSYFYGSSSNTNFIEFEKDHEFDAQYGGVLNVWKGSTCNTAVTWNVTAGCYNNSILTPVPNLIGGTFGPTGFQYGPIFWGSRDWYTQRDNVVNLHWGIPHSQGGGRDDIQFLYDVSWQRTLFATNLSDFGAAMSDILNSTATKPDGTILPPCASAASLNCNTIATSGQAPTWKDKAIFQGMTGVPLSFADLHNIATYWFPGGPTDRPFNSIIDPNQSNGDSYNNSVAITKLQYQHNMGSNAFIRIYGFTNYSDWLQFGPAGITPDFYGSISGDYKLGSHTRGVAANFTDQMTDKNLINVNLAYTTSNTFRNNNATVTAAMPFIIAYLVDSTNPTNGQCYRATGPTVLAVPKSCFATSMAGRPSSYVIATPGSPIMTTRNATDPSLSPGAFNLPSSHICGGGPCEYFIVSQGLNQTYNTVTPQFSAASIQDTWKPNDRWTFTFGLRYDDFKYVLKDTTGNAARTFWVNAYNGWTCFDPVFSTVVGPSTTSTTPVNCSLSGRQQLAFSPVSDPSENYPEWQPRFGMTFLANPNDVLRASYGKYAQPSSSAFQQYDTIQPNLVAGPNLLFYANGYHNPSHFVPPEESYSTDFSWEHETPNADLSWSITPYLRKTRNEASTILLDPRTNFVSALPIGKKTVTGVEFLLRKGDLNRNGLFAQLSYTYTNAYIQFTPLPNGQTVVTGLNQGVGKYNAFTSFCATNFTDPRCGIDPSTGMQWAVAPTTAFPCFTPSTGLGNAACTAGSLANPYWNAPPQPLFDPNGKYAVYSRFAGATPLSGSTDSYLTPHVVTLILNYKHNLWSVTPTLQLQAGGVYGRPLDVPGINPSLCHTLPGSTNAEIASDPRYPFGGPAVGTGGLPYDAASCTGGLGAVPTIPDPFTGKFDNFGAFVQPSKLGLNIGVSFQASPHLKLSMLGANVYTGCYGGTKVPWNISSYTKAGCVYSGNTFYPANFYNPGDVIDSQIKYPYAPVFGSVFQQVPGAQNNPFQAYFTAELKI